MVDCAIDTGKSARDKSQMIVNAGLEVQGKGQLSKVWPSSVALFAHGRAVFTLYSSFDVY